MSTHIAKPTLTETKAVLGDLNLPVQPHLVSKIQAQYPDLEAMATELKRDPALCFAALKLVNNPRFELPAQASVDEAVRFLGLDNVNMMINAVLLAMAKRENFNSLELTEFWESSRAVANCAALAARQLNIDLVDEAYCVGILHHVGMPMLWKKYANYFDALRGDESSSLTQLENALFNSDHATVGYYLARGIRLPKPVCETIRDHHRSQELFEQLDKADETELMLMALLKMAEDVMDESNQLLGRRNDDEWLAIKPMVLELLGISEFDYGDLRDLISEH